MQGNTPPRWLKLKRIFFNSLGGLAVLVMRTKTKACKCRQVIREKVYLFPFPFSVFIFIRALDAATGVFFAVFLFLKERNADCSGSCVQKWTHFISPVMVARGRLDHIPLCFVRSLSAESCRYIHKIQRWLVWLWF